MTQDTPQEATKTEYLNIRITPGQRDQLVKIANASITQNISDHVRYAIDEYIARNTKGGRR